MELEELRQRLLLRSKSTEIPPIAHPVQIPEVALSQAASKVKWETTLSPEVTARVGKTDGTSAKSENGKADKTENATANARSADKEKAEGPANTASAGSGNPAAQAEPISILSSSVEQLSEPTEAFREHFAQLSKLLEPIDTATSSSELALKRITGFYEHLSSLANNFQSVKAFAEQVKTISASFEPMKGLDTQLDQVMKALYGNVKEVGAALAPVKTFQAKVRQLATTLESIEKLEAQIVGLAEAFRPAAEKPAWAADAAAEKSAPVAQAA